MSGRSLLFQVPPALLRQFFDAIRRPTHRGKANDPNRFHRLPGPRIADLLGRAIGIILRAVGPMHDVVAPLHGGIEGLLQFLFVPLQPVGDLLPRIVESQQRSRDVDAPPAAEVAEVQDADHLVGDEQRVGIGESGYGALLRG